jgi:hypothetical protein
MVANIYVNDIVMKNAIVCNSAGSSRLMRLTCIYQYGARIKVFGGSPHASKLPKQGTIFDTSSYGSFITDSTAGGGTGYVKNVTFSNMQVISDLLYGALS